MVTIILLSVLIYILPIIIAGILIYLDMAKSETIEDYITDMENPEVLLLLIVPMANYFLLLLMILSMIYEVIKHYKK